MMRSMCKFFKIFFFSLLFLCSLLCGAICFFLHNHTIDFSVLQQDVYGKPCVLLDETGREWGRFQLDKRKYVPLELVPDHLINAFLVTEDRAFFKHPGISFRGIIRSLFVNVWRGKKLQGASTITQQLVRLLFFDSKKTFSRKVKEQIYAILVERQWSKEEILEAYLNNVYFGYGIYGIQAASQRFWSKNIQDVTIDEAAVLASVMKSPKLYSPIHAPENVQNRRNMILSMMFNHDMITGEQYQVACKNPLKIKDAERNMIAPHYKEMIRMFLEDLVGKHALYTDGLIVQTTLNMQMQKVAEEAFHDHVSLLRLSLHDKVDGGLITIDSATGEIRTMVGGYDFAVSKFNRAVQAYRQMGSVFKVFVYAAALEQGLKLSDVEIDEPVELLQNGKLWQPKNYTNDFIGPMTRAYALSRSNNMVAIKTLLKAGINNVIDVARRCHISAPMQPYPSLALGCVDVNILETVGAFNVIVNHGKYVQPHCVVWVKNNVGKKIYKSSPCEQQVLDASIASQIARVLTFSIHRLKNKLNKNMSFEGDALGKTGTTNDSRICWFCGATPELTTAIYVACDQNQSLGHNVFGSKTATPIWLQFHEKIAKRPTNFYYDPRLKEVLLDWRTGVLNSDQSHPDVVALLE